MDGLKLACVARNRWPPIEIIVTSGLDFKAAPRLPERGVFLSKPYTPAQITGALLRLAA
jgi:hypothetical protein